MIKAGAVFGWVWCRYHREYVFVLKFWLPVTLFESIALWILTNSPMGYFSGFV